MITIKEVARLAGVAPTTASYALNNRPEVKPETRERVLKAAQELNYVPNKLAQSFRNKRSKVLNIITNEDIERNNTFTTELFGILAGAREKKYNVLITLASKTDCEDDMWISNTLGNQLCDGYLVLGNLLDLLIQKIVLLQKKGVLLSSHSNYQIAQVNCDGYQAIEDLVKICRLSSRKRIAYLSYALNSEEEKIREKAFTETASNMAFSEPITFCCGYETEKLDEFVDKCLCNQYDAVICWNDALALSLLAILRSRNIGVPEKIAVAGVDDISSAAQYGLTTARQPLFDKGYKAVMTLIDEIETDTITSDKITIPCSVVRRTTL